MAFSSAVNEDVGTLDLRSDDESVAVNAGTTPAAFVPTDVADDKFQPNSRTPDEAASDFAAFAIPAAVAGGVDTFLQSVGITDEETLTNSLAENFPSFGMFFKENRQGARLVGDLAFALIPGQLAVKAIRGGGTLAKLVAGSGKEQGFVRGLLSNVFTSGQKIDEITAQLVARDRLLAQAGKQFSAVKDSRRVDLAFQARKLKVTDSVKQAVAFEAGVGLTFNQSDALYPDEFTALENAALIAAPAGIFVGAELLYFNRILRNSLEANKGVAAAALNPENLPLDIRASVSGKRDTRITINALAKLAGNQSTARQNVNQTAEIAAKARSAQDALSTSLTADSLDEIKLAFKDKTARNDRSGEVTQGHLNTATAQLNADPTAFVGMQSLMPLPSSQAEIATLLSTKDAAIAAVDRDIAKLVADPKITGNAAEGFSTEDATLMAKMSALQRERGELQGQIFIVHNTDGTRSHLLEHRTEFGDTNGKVVSVPGTTIEDPLSRVDFDNGRGGVESSAAVTSDGRVIIPPTKDITINGVDVTKVLDRNANFQAGEDFSLILQDMGEDWHYLTGTRGKEAFATLDANIQNEINKWTGISASSKLREWIAAGDPRAQLVREAYRGVGQRLRELADTDGTVTLFRGESKSETRAIENGDAGVNDVVSMSADPEVAGKFAQSGGNLISRRVHVNDVIMIVGGSGREVEYIVKGNTNRIIGEQVTQQSFESLSYFKKTGLYAAGQRSLDRFDPAKTEIILNPNDHFFTMDFALEAAKRFPNSINLGKFDSLEQVELASLSQKFTNYLRERKVTIAAQGDNPLINITPEARTTMTQLVRGLNLPNMTPGFKGQPVVDLFESLIAQGTTKLDDVFDTLAQFKEAVITHSSLNELSQFTDEAIHMRGNMFRNNPDNAPFVAINRPYIANDFTRDALLNKTIAMNDERLNALRTSGESGATLVPLLTKLLDEHPGTAFAKRVNEIVEDSARGRGLIGTQSAVLREDAVLRAMDEVAGFTQRQIEKFIGTQILAPHVGNFNRIQASANKGSLEAFNAMRSARLQGWDLAADVVEVDVGKFAFALTDTKRNRAIWERQGFAKDAFNFDQGPLLMPAVTPAIAGKRTPIPAIADELAMETMDSVTSLSRQAGVEQNAIREAQGVPQVSLRNHHIPPANFAGKELIFMATESGEIIGTVAGRTLGASNKLADEVVLAQGKQGIRLHPVTQADVGRFLEARGEAFNKTLIDFSDTANQTGAAKGTGQSTLIEVGPGALVDSIESIQASLQSSIRQTRAAYFDPQVNQARALHNVSAPETSNVGRGSFQRYLGLVYGNSQLSPNDPVSRLYNAVESGYDDVLHAIGTRKDQAFGNNRTVNRATRRRFEALSAKLGEHNPFTDTQDFLERTYAVKRPQSLARHAAALNKLTTFLTLGMFETGHALLNLTSLAATMPAVIQALKRIPGESAAQYDARTGTFGTIMSDDTAMFNPIRAVMSGMHDFWQPEFREQMARAANAGLFDQEIAEMVRTITAPREGYAASIASKFMDITSFLSRRSEELSRSISFAVGLHIAKKGMGITAEPAQFAFAHRFANDVIGDYRPGNRPRIFQGAVGMPLGLFTTFMINYNTRIFSYIENKQLGALATQFATQAAVFGGQSVPGFDQFMNVIGSNYDGSVNPVDGLRKMIGNDDITDTLIYGGLSSLPKLFGAEDGIDISSRGNANVNTTVPTLLNFTAAPGIQMGVKFFELFRKSLQSIRAEGGINVQQELELLQSYSQNRFIRNVAIIAAGVSVDKRQQVITKEVRNGISLAARALGLRPIQESERIKALARNRSASFAQRDRMLQMQNNLGSKIRGGTLEAEDLTEAASEYVRFGGNPSGIASFMANQFLRANISVTERRLLDLIRNPSQSEQALRLFNTLE